MENTNLGEDSKMEKITIASKIVSFKLKDVSEEATEEQLQNSQYRERIAELEEAVKNLRQREPLKVSPDVILSGRRYTIPPSASYDHSFYININDIVDENGERRPFDIFINTNSQESMQWINALARTISGIFKREKNPEFIGEQLRGIFDPRGGYYRKGGNYKPSIVSEIGEKILEHLTNLAMENENRFFHKGLEEIGSGFIPEDIRDEDVVCDDESEEILKNAMFCPKCTQKTFINSGSCPTCLECGYSKCG